MPEQIDKTVNDLLPNSRYSLRARAINRFGVKSEWSEALDFYVEDDNPPPSKPAPPEVFPEILLTFYIRHYLGKDSSEFVFDLETDLSHLEVHLGSAQNFIPTLSTKYGTIEASQAHLRSQTPVFEHFRTNESGTFWAKVVAVNRSGKKSPPSNGVSFFVEPAQLGGGGGAVAVQDSGTPVIPEASILDFGNRLSVTNQGNNKVTIDSGELALGDLTDVDSNIEPIFGNLFIADGTEWKALPRGEEWDVLFLNDDEPSGTEWRKVPVVHHITLHAKEGQMIPPGGGYVIFDSWSEELPARRRGFDSVTELPSEFSAIPLDISGELEFIFSGEWGDERSGGSTIAEGLRFRTGGTFRAEIA